MSQEIRQTRASAKGPKGLQKHLREGESILFSAPGFWDNGEVNYSTACDLVLTNQRVMGYYSKSFPREHLFLDALDLDRLTRVEFRQKSYEPLFRELLLSDGEHKVYLRTTRRHSEKLYELLRARTPIQDEPGKVEDAPTEQAESARAETHYKRQEVRASFESSSLGITLLFVGGLLLEVIGVLLIQSQGISIGLPLCIAGLVAVITALLIRRQRTRR